MQISFGIALFLLKSVDGFNGCSSCSTRLFFTSFRFVVPHCSNKFFCFFRQVFSVTRIFIFVLRKKTQPQRTTAAVCKLFHFLRQKPPTLPKNYDLYTIMSNIIYNFCQFVANFHPFCPVKYPCNNSNCFANEGLSRRLSGVGTCSRCV